MPFFITPQAKQQIADAAKGQKTLAHVAAEAAQNHDPDEDHDVKPHDRYGRPLSDDGEPVEQEDTTDLPAEVDSHDDDEFDPDDKTDPVEKSRSRHTFGDAVQVDGHGHGGLPRAQIYDPRRPQPQDAGTLSTPLSGALASSVGSNPGGVTLQSLNYRVGAAPTVSFPNVPLAQPAPHTAPTAPQGGRRD